MKLIDRTGWPSVAHVVGVATATATEGRTREAICFVEL